MSKIRIFLISVIMAAIMGLYCANQHRLGESCETNGSTDECEAGLICTSESSGDGKTCETICTSDADCTDGYTCKTVSSSDLFSCQY
ncbi:MAG: hypothetical protein OEZ13_11025 [Spirochaetia bacterium]|nr:hypothetical protein [Spirochaetia bacterium]